MITCAIADLREGEIVVFLPVFSPRSAEKYVFELRKINNYV